MSSRTSAALSESCASLPSVVSEIPATYELNGILFWLDIIMLWFTKMFNHVQVEKLSSLGSSSLFSYFFFLSSCCCLGIHILYSFTVSVESSPLPTDSLFLLRLLHFLLLLCFCWVFTSYWFTVSVKSFPLPSSMPYLLKFPFHQINIHTLLPSLF